MAVEYVPFSKLLTDIVDNRGRTCPTSAQGIPLIATKCIRNDRLYPVCDTTRRVSADTYDTWFRGHPHSGDLIFVTKGSPGRVCIAPEPVDFCIAQDMVAVRADATRVYPKYLFALLRSRAVQSQIVQMHVGTLIPHFKKGDFDKLLLPVHDRETQIVVGDFYFDLSAKIELNRRMNETLEAIARAIFNSWFVDFDPVRAKAEGRQPPGMDTETAALFPDSFEDSPLGNIPTGWIVSTVGKEFHIAMGHSPPGETYNESGHGIPFYQGKADFGYRYPIRRVYCTDPSRFAEEGDTLVSVRAPVGTINMASEACCVGRGLAAVQHGSRAVSYTYYSMGALNEGFARFEAEGTVFGSVNAKDFAGMHIVAPPLRVVNKFEALATPLDAYITANWSESHVLSRLRDTLLPKLLSGELRVKQAEEVVESVV